jgi:hypothetical protein
MTLKLYTKRENIILWHMPFQGKKKKQKVQYVLFLYSTSYLGRRSKDRMDVRSRGMQDHSTTTRGPQFIREICMEELFSMVS